MRRLLLWTALAFFAIASTTFSQESELAVRALAFSPDGKWLAAGRGRFEQEQGDVTVWNLAQRKAAFTLAGKRGITAVAYSGDGKLLAVTQDKVAMLHDSM